jgi:hypothetical protein
MKASVKNQDLSQSEFIQIHFANIALTPKFTVYRQNGE